MGELTVYVEEYASANKSERAFDTNLWALNVLPLLVRIENNGRDSYAIKVQEISLRRETSLSAMTPAETASKAAREGIAQAVGWSLIVPIVSIPVAAGLSAMNTGSVNTELAQDFNRKGLKEGPLKQGEHRTGFLFYQLEEGTKTLSGLTLELKLGQLVTKEETVIAIPLPEITIDTK